MGDGPPAPAQPWTTQPRRAPAAVSMLSRPRPSEILGRAGERGGQAGRRALGPGCSQPRPPASLPQVPPACPAPHSPAPPPRLGGPIPAPPPAGVGRALTYRQRTQVPGLAAQPKLPRSGSPQQPSVPAGEAALERERRGLRPRPRPPAPYRAPGGHPPTSRLLRSVREVTSTTLDQAHWSCPRTSSLATLMGP